MIPWLIFNFPFISVDFPGGASGKEPACQCKKCWERWIWSLGGEDPLEEEMATHSSILAWRIPWTAGGLQFLGLHRVGHDWSNLVPTYCNQFSRSIMSNSLRPNGLQHARLPCRSPTPGACSISCPLCWWCQPTFSSSVVLFSCLQSFPASGSFPIQFFASAG